MLGYDYIDWLIRYAFPHGYTRLINKLANTNYIWLFELDENRAAAGIGLRARYSLETGVYQSDVAEGPCSCLEMMIGYAKNLVDQSGFGNEQTFINDFLFNTGLARYDDDHWDEAEVEQVIDIWLTRQYSPNGQGNLLVTSMPIDMRRMDTWSQLANYITEYYPIEG